MAIENTYLLGKNITLGCGFDLQAKAPLDSRQTVPAFAGLQALINDNAAYEGMIVYDEETKKTYQALIIDGVLKFREFGLTDAELKALIASETTAAMEFKGAATALPENPAKGDMYKVTATFKIGEEDVKVGDSIVYDGTQWFIIPSGDDIEDTWRPVTDVGNDSTLTFTAGDKLDVAVAENGTITYSHAEIAAPTNMNEEGDEQTRTYITELITDNHGHVIGFKTATENVEDTNTTYAFEGIPATEGEAAPSSVYFQVTSSEEGATAEVIYIDAYTRNEADGKFVAQEAGKSLISDTEIARLAGVDNYDDEEVRGLIDAIDNHSHGNKTELDKIADGDVAKWNAAEQNAKDYVDDQIEELALGTMSKETADDYVKKSEATGFGDILTKTEAASTYVDSQSHALIYNQIQANFNTIQGSDANMSMRQVAQAEVEAAAGNYATSAQGALADTAVQEITTGSANGTISVDGEDVAVKGLGDAAYRGVDTLATLDSQNLVTSGAVAIQLGLKADASSLGDLAGKDEVAKSDLAEDLKTEIEGKVASVAAGDKSITMGGTATAPTVAVNISSAEGNAIELADDGLKVILPESTKVEASETNGNIKVDGQEVTVYTHVDKHAIADVDGLQDALDGKSDDDHKHVKADITDFAHTHTASEITDFATEVAKVKVDEAGKADTAAKVDNALTVKVGGADVVFDGSAAKTADVDTAIEAALTSALSWGSF